MDIAIYECEKYYPAFQFVLWGNNEEKLHEYIDSFVDFEFITTFNFDNPRVHTLTSIDSSSIFSHLINFSSAFKICGCSVSYTLLPIMSSSSIFSP